jgi:hypothetical protein
MRFCAAHDHALAWNAVHLLADRAHEIAPPAGRDVACEPVRRQVGEQLDHRHVRTPQVAATQRGMPRSTAELAYISDGRGGTVIHKAEPDYLDDGPEKPVRIWSRIGRRPLLAAGNSNGDVPMLEFTQHKDKPSLRLLVLHDDGEREFDYTAGAEQALEHADAAGWTVVSMKNDWTTIF